jgi:hypothetical protein
MTHDLLSGIAGNTFSRQVPENGVPFGVKHIDPDGGSIQQLILEAMQRSKMFFASPQLSFRLIDPFKHIIDIA